MELQVLRLGRDTRSWEELIAAANACALMDGNAIEQMVVIAQYRITVDVAERANHIIVSQFGLRMNKGHRTDLIHNDMLVLRVNIWWASNAEKSPTELTARRLYLFLTIWAVNEASATTRSPTNM